MPMIDMGSEEGGFELFVDGLLEENRRDLPGALKSAVVHLEDATKRTLAGRRTGRTYFVPGSQQTTYTASAPGQAPASATGQLRRMVQHRVDGWEGDEISGGVGVDGQAVPYAKRLEYGGFHMVRRDQAVRSPSGWFTVKAGTVIRIAPRPWLRPTFLREEGTVDAILRGLLP